MSADCLGPLPFYVTFIIMSFTSHLDDFYRGATGSVAYVDESFRLDGARKFYIVGIALVSIDQIFATRSQLLSFYGGEPLHAGAMYSRGELETIRQSAGLVSEQNDGLEVMVATGIADADKGGVSARRQCISYGLSVAIADVDCQRVVFDAHKNPVFTHSDRETMNELRRSQQVHEEMVAIHTYPRIEPLLGLPDVLAWTYRQEYTGRGSSWFDALRGQARVHLL
jgi:hypothetical protein